MEHNARSRVLTIPSGHNIRDLGGIPLPDGRETRRGILVRGEAPALLGQDGVAGLLDYGVRHVIDLRGDDEVMTEGIGTLAEHVQSGLVTYQRADMTSTPSELVHGDDLYADLAHTYLNCLNTGGERLAGALDTALHAASKDASAVYFHCAVGKDRTGTVAGMVLNLLGADPDLIVDDYVLTGYLFGPIIARLRRSPAYQRSLAEVSDDALIPRREAMDGFLSLLDAQGGAEQWLLEHGLGVGAVARWRNILTVD